MGSMIVSTFPGYLTVQETADFLGRSHAQVTRYIGQGLIDAVKQGNQYFVRKSSLKDFKPPLRGNPAFRKQSAK